MSGNSGEQAPPKEADGPASKKQRIPPKKHDPNDQPVSDKVRTTAGVGLFNCLSDEAMSRGDSINHSGINIWPLEHELPFHKVPWVMDKQDKEAPSLLIGE